MRARGGLLMLAAGAALFGAGLLCPAARATTSPPEAAAPPPHAGAPAGEIDRPAAGRPSPPPDSLRLRRPIELEGGRVLSVGEVRRHLPAGPGAPPLGSAEVGDALARLGARLVAQGRYEGRLELWPDSLGGARLLARDGPMARWASLAVRHAPADTAAPVRPRLDFARAGEPFDPRKLEQALESWLEESLDRGHPFAAARVESIAVAHGEVAAGIAFDAGPFHRVTEVAFPGLRSTRPSFLRRWIGFRPGRPYRESAWRDARIRLERTGLFTATEEPRIEPLPGGGARVHLPVEEARHNRIEGAIGYSGVRQSLSGFIDLELGNLFGGGRRLAARWERIREDQSRLGLEWREPLLGPLPVGAQVRLDQEDQDSTFSRLVLEGSLESFLGRDLAAYAGVEYHRSLLGVEPAERVRRVSSLFGGRWDGIRPGAWRGHRLEATIRSGRSEIRPPGGGPSRRVRVERGGVSAERYQPLRGPVLLRARVAGEALGREDPLPLSEALRFGGATTVRGWPEEGFLARRYLAGQIEVGPAFAGGRAYAFLDAAWWRTFLIPARDRDLLGYGLGLATENARRRVALDLAVPRGAGLGDGRLHIRLESRF